MSHRLPRGAHTRSVNLSSALLLALTVSLLPACGEDDSRIELAAPDRAMFESTVMPVLLRDCAFSGCHGSQERFFQVLGPGRTRLYVELKASDPISPDEVSFNYERARSMLDPADPDGSLLLRKPLAVEAGGAGHLGTDGFGRDVYASKADPGFQVLVNWTRNRTTVAQPMQAIPGQIPPGG